MTSIIYEIVEHDGGWAYRVDRVYSETFGSRAEAAAAADRAAREQRLSGQTEAIAYEDEEGVRHEELARGTDRPATSVRDGEGGG